MNISFQNVSKSFGSVKVLKDVSFHVRSGSFHALVGENGAGKSTLLNILHGVYPEYRGSILFNNREKHFKNVSDGIHSGIAKVHQELQVVDKLNVGQNILLGYEPLFWKKLFIDHAVLYKKADSLLKTLGCRFSSRDSVSELSTAELQMITVAKSLFHKAEVISFDEPTASLSQLECDNLFSVIKQLKSKGVTIIYVSHRMEEVFKLSDSITVLRDGEHIFTKNNKDLTEKQVIKSMVGEKIDYSHHQHRNSSQKEILLDVKNLHCKKKFSGISFQLHKGEILGFSGLVGAKRTDLMRALFGADKNKLKGCITLRNTAYEPRDPLYACKHSIALITENRKQEGFVSHLNNLENITLSSLKNFSRWGFINKGERKMAATNSMNMLKVVPATPEYQTSLLSGGNQQKIVIGKWLTAQPRILILDEPTKGIDIGAKSQIYSLLETLAAKGVGIMIVSSEIQEIMALCDRALVMHEGRQITILERSDFSYEKLLTHNFGG